MSDLQKPMPPPPETRAWFINWDHQYQDYMGQAALIIHDEPTAQYLYAALEAYGAPRLKMRVAERAL